MEKVNIALKKIEMFFKGEKSNNPNGDEEVEQTLFTIQDEEKMTIEEMIYSRGYPLEIHNVETEDGFILRVYRIPGGKGEKDYKTKVKPAILFQHGLLDSSDGWICNSEEKCLPYLFANSNFDVWLSNSRGNKHSKCHTQHSPINIEFWSFSFHEMGLIDLPAVLEHIKKNNKSEEKIIYVGHSQGTCLLFAALTQKLEYFKSKIKLFIALAPVARVSNMKSTFLKFLQSVKFHKMLKASSQFEVFPSVESGSKFSSWLNKNFSTVTNLFLDMISDKNSKETNNAERLGVYLTHYPAGASLKSITHFIQNFKSKKFSYYDYKKEANLYIYKQVKAPEYDLSVIRDFPIALFAGKEDKLASLEDVKWLKEELGENVVFYKEYEAMGHITFLMGRDIGWFSDLMEVVLKFSSVSEVD
jgi:lysosomal acid lipase/cholesteryl ester hydrolase